MFFLTTYPSRVVLAFVLASFLVLGLFGMSNMGVVGEVAWTWMVADPTSNLAVAPPASSWGSLTAASTRPMATFTLGQLHLPLAVNLYTGGIADWPARVLSGFGFPVVQTFHLVAGGILIVLTHRFLRIHATNIAANCASILLATDWVFVFFRRALGGTELLLQAAVLLCLWALWSRRWAGGRHGLTAFAAGVGLGLSAKLTFVLSLLPLMLTAFLLRRDKPRLRPPLPTRWRPVVLAGLLPTVPLLVAWLMHSQAGLEGIESHDHLGIQWERLSDTLDGRGRPARESLAALQAWLGEGCSFLTAAWDAEAPTWHSPLRFLGWGVILVGVPLAWRERDPTPRLALTRFCSVFVPLQVLATWGVARDLHHIATATPSLMILAGLCIDTICSQLAAKGSLRRAAVAIVCCTPWVLVGLRSIMITDTILDTVQRPTVSAKGQHALVEMLKKNQAQRVVTLDYESAGALDILAPDIEFQHGWTHILTARQTALVDLVRLAIGGHLLVIPDAPSWTYNLKPRGADLLRAAELAGVDLVVVDHLPGGAANLYAVGSQKGQP